jgi:hypothetical protein
MKNLAEQIAETMGSDGMRFTAPDGRDLATLVENAGGEMPNTSVGGRVTLNDGSALIVFDSCWDIAAYAIDGCTCMHDEREQFNPSGIAHSDGCALAPEMEY